MAGERVAGALMASVRGTCSGQAVDGACASVRQAGSGAARAVGRVWQRNSPPRNSWIPDPALPSPTRALHAARRRLPERRGPAEQVLFGRQPIVDRDGRMQAFEFLFRPGRANVAPPADDLVATSQVLHHVFAELGVERALGPYRGFVNCDARILLMPDTLDVLPSERIVIEILESVRPDAAVIDRLRELKRAGFLLALDDYDGQSAQPSAFLALMDFVKIDLARVPAAALAATLDPLRGLPARLVAEKVQTREQATDCRAAGIDLFQGYLLRAPGSRRGPQARHAAARVAAAADAAHRRRGHRPHRRGVQASPGPRRSTCCASRTRPRCSA